MTLQSSALLLRVGEASPPQSQHLKLSYRFQKVPFRGWEAPGSQPPLRLSEEVVSWPGDSPCPGGFPPSVPFSSNSDSRATGLCPVLLWRTCYGRRQRISATELDSQIYFISSLFMLLLFLLLVSFLFIRLKCRGCLTESVC